jgi:hypothetical protein
MRQMNVMQNSSVVAVTALQDAGSRNGPARNKDYSLLKNVQTGSGHTPHPIKKKLSLQ